MKTFLIIPTVVVMLVCGYGWWWWGYVYPLQEFHRLGEVRFPDETKTIGWKREGWGVNGRFEIPYYQVDLFVRDNPLTDMGGEVMVGDHCIHGGKNHVHVRFDKKSGIADIRVLGPDHAGTNPCEMKEGAAP